MYVATAIFASIALVAAQEIGFTDGDSVVAGPNAISNPNVNNGWQADSSLFDSAGGAGAAPQVFNDVVGSSFTKINSNTAIKDNLVNNPSASFVKGNDGWTANGDRNQLGPVQNEFGAFHRRSGDVVFAGNHHQAGSQFVHAVGTQPLLAAYKRSGDVVFADKHHQANSQVAESVAVPPRIVRPFPVSPAFIKRDVVIADNRNLDAAPAVAHLSPFFASWQPVHPAFVAPVPISHPAVVAQPVHAEQNGQKATVVQNQA